MNKYFFLLISPFLFLSFGCEKDTNNTTQIPVSEYPEYILGHWESVEEITTEMFETIEIDPIYGTETITTNQEDSVLYINQFFTFNYDETVDMIWWDPSYNVWRNLEGGYNLSLDSIFYSMNLIIGEMLIPLQSYSGIIQNFTNSNFTINHEVSDTSQIINNSYTIIHTLTSKKFERINELPPLD
tara:strand:- start:618 stop:1172 length:555 start_codon:yes stop_codon:yes gene_type:complete